MTHLPTADEPSDRGETASVGASRIRALVLLRITLIIATSYLLIAELGPASVPWYILVLLGGVLASTALVPLVPPRMLESQAFIATTILGDTAWITIALVASGRFTGDFFYLYFFVLFLAGIGENLRMIALGAVVVSGVYLIVLASTGGSSQLLKPGALLRVPFLFAVAIFYGYLMDRLRHEQRRAREEADLARRYAEHRQVLAAANQALGAEIAERRRVEEQLQQANAELQVVAETRVNFVSMVTHELRTPLTAISNAAALLMRSADLGSQADRRMVELLASNSDRMKLLVSDLLDLSKAAAGRLRLETEPVGVAAVLDRVVASFAQQAGAARVTLTIEPVPPDLVVRADPRRVEQVLANLVSNGIEACSAGGHVTLAARRDTFDVEIAVLDDGIGIDAEEQARVFEPFYQAGSDLDRRRKGTGLGLAISRDLVRAHGGDLVLASEVGRGSRFSFRLPQDCARGRELLEFEALVRRFREHPYFSLLVVVPQSVNETPSVTAANLESLRAGLAPRLPRASDQLVPQPAHGRLLLVMLSTPLAGGSVVRGRLERVLAEDPPSDARGQAIPFELRGPAAYPDDGRFGRQLVERAIARKTMPEEA